MITTYAFPSIWTKTSYTNSLVFKVTCWMCLILTAMHWLRVSWASIHVIRRSSRSMIADVPMWCNNWPKKSSFPFKYSNIWNAKKNVSTYSTFGHYVSKFPSEILILIPTSHCRVICPLLRACPASPLPQFGCRGLWNVPQCQYFVAVLKTWRQTLSTRSDTLSKMLNT